MRAMAGLRTGVIVPIPAAGAAVDGWRERTCNVKPSRGVPAHITLLYPFVPAAALTDAMVAALAEILGAVPAFDLELRSTMRMAGALCLAPEPAEPFVRLTEAIVRRFPEHPPYEGAYDHVVPHLTVAQGGDDLLEEAERDVRRLLPIAAAVREAALLEEIEPGGARWRIGLRLPLA
jgi:2'-5' RNA ligase